LKTSYTIGLSLVHLGHLGITFKFGQVRRFFEETKKKPYSSDLSALDRSAIPGLLSVIARIKVLVELISHRPHRRLGG
jgi:hypothetical protein